MQQTLTNNYVRANKIKMCSVQLNIPSKFIDTKSIKLKVNQTNEIKS